MSGLDNMAIGERKALDQRKGLFRCIDRAVRAMGEPECVVGVGMSEHDCRGIHHLQPAEPIGSAIDHHARMALSHQQSAVAEMAARPDLDLAPGAQKGELDAALLALLDRDPLLVLLSLWTLGQSYRGLV
jgi:hypothetical protein